MKLSIIITNYRQADAIKEMLSRVDVPNDDVEFIVVDDCSDDPHLGDLKRYLSRTFRNARVVRCHSKVCVGGARNVGAIEAVGDWLWFVDGDDAIKPGAIPRVLDAIASESDVDCFVLDYEIVSPDETELISFTNCRPADRLKLWNVGIMAWFKVISRDAFVEFRAAFSEDNDWWVRQCIALIARRHGTVKYGTVKGGPCYAYQKLGPGAFTSALTRFSLAPDPGTAVRSFFVYPETAENVVSVLRMIAELVSLAQELVRRRMPYEFVQHHEFVLRWWLNRIAKIGGAK